MESVGELKSTGTVENGDGLWFSPNLGATNNSGFTALPGGSRSSEGIFDLSGNELGFEGNWWVISNSYILGCNLIFNNIYIAWIFDKSSDGHYGFSVRCVKD